MILWLKLGWPCYMMQNKKGETETGTESRND